jgi:hypothetical protein
MMKLQLLINNLGFPFMFMCLKIGNELFCYNYSYNKLLIGKFLIIWSAFWWMSWCFLVVLFWKLLHPNWSNLKLMWCSMSLRCLNKCDNPIGILKRIIHNWCALDEPSHQFGSPNSFKVKHCG